MSDVVTATYLSSVPILWNNSQSKPWTITRRSARHGEPRPDPLVAGESSLLVQANSSGETITVYPGGTDQVVVKIAGIGTLPGHVQHSQIAHLVLYGGSGTPACGSSRG